MRHVSLSLLSQVKTEEWSLSRKREQMLSRRWLHNFRLWQIRGCAQEMRDRDGGTQIIILFERGGVKE